MQWIAKILLLFSYKRLADRSYKYFAFLRFMYCKNQFDNVCCLYLEWTTTNKIGLSLKKDDNREFSVGARFEQMLLSH